MMEKRHNHVRNGIIVSLLLCAVFFLVAKTQTPGPTMLRSSASEVGPLSENVIVLGTSNEGEDDWDTKLGKKFGPPYARHGTVRYTSYDDDGERVYKRVSKVCLKLLTRYLLSS